MFLKVTDTWHRVNGKDIHWNIFQCAVVEHGIGQHVTTDTATTPAHQIDFGWNNAVLAKGFDNLLLQLLLRDAAIAIVIFTPQPGAFDFHIFNRDAGGFEAVVLRLGQLLALPVALAFDDVYRVLDVFLPALAEQGSAEPVILGLGEQFIGLQVAGAGAVDHDPVGELASGVMRGQCGDQFPIPIVNVCIIKLGRSCTAEENS